MQTDSAASQDLGPQAVHNRLIRHEITLVDVREPAEYAAERIPGALLFPLSSFDPAALPVAGGRPVVLHCGSGKRSATALAACAAAGIPVRQHMRGGIAAWKAAGLPTLTLDPSTGRMIGRGS